MQIFLDPSSIESYRLFLKIKKLPHHRFTGCSAWFPDEYAEKIGMEAKSDNSRPYEPMPWLFDYQEAIARLAIKRKKFGVFAEPGLGKQNIQFEFARYVSGLYPNKIVLMVAPLMVVRQAVQEKERFYGDLFKLEQVSAKDLGSFLKKGRGLAITNYEALRDDLEQGNLVALVPDEMLKSAYGKWIQVLTRIGKGLPYKLVSTGTPAPNDRIEYAVHAVFLDQFPTLNSFYSKFFVNRGQVQDRWELKRHAVRSFYRSLSHWSIFLTNPSTYGWRDNAGTIPPISVEIHNVPLTKEQESLVFEKAGPGFIKRIGGISSRSVLSQISKGNYRGRSVATNKPSFIKALVDSWGDSTIIWCKYNAEQELIARTFPGCADISGATPIENRLVLIEDFKAGRRKVLVSKPDILGFGLNLQVCTRMIFSGLEDSYESYFQCVKRANRVGSTKLLGVHIPVTEVERPMVENVLVKARRVDHDTQVQEKLFFENAEGIR